MNWYIEGNHWILCEILSNMFGIATVKLYTGEKRTGKPRKGLYGLLVDAIVNQKA